jgi:hypothetical protein
MRMPKTIVAKKLGTFISANILRLEGPNMDRTMKNTMAGTIIYTILSTSNRRVSYIFFPKLNEGNIDDSFSPILTIDKR